MADPEIRIKIKADGSEAKKTFSDFAKEIPGVGRALDVLRNPVALLGEAGESLAEARDGAKQFADNLGSIRTEAEGIAKALDAALKAKKALFDEHNERDDAAEGLALAQIDRDVASKKLSEPDARVRKAGFNQFYAGRRHGRAQELLRSEVEMIDERDRAADGEIGEITGRIGEAQATSRNAAQLEAKRLRAKELRAAMLAAMRDEEEMAGVPFGAAAVSDELGAAKVEGRRKRYFDAATELSVIAAGMPRNTPFTTTAQAREEAVTTAGVPRIAELTSSRTDLAARRDALQRQMETGAIRFDLGRRTAVTQLETSAHNDLNQHREQFGNAIVQSARGGGRSGFDQGAAAAQLDSMTQSAENIGPALEKAIGRAEKAMRQLEKRVGEIETGGRNNRDGR